MVERAYRDSRINRIFEGTNEINRLLATGMLLKRAQRGQLPLVEAVKKLQAEVLAAPGVQLGAQPEEARLIANGKKTALLLLGAAYQRYLTSLEEQQEILAGITDVSMMTFAMESAWLRARKCDSEMAADMSAVLLRESMDLIENTARTVLSACAEGDTLRTHMVVLKRFTKYEPINAIGLRRKIAARLLQAKRYLV
jgi:butyryl-CoA dehydrogenase